MRRVIPALALLLGGSLIAACGGGTPAPQLTPLTVGLGFIPSVQFAQFYYSQRQGYYRDAGLAVTFQNKIDPELITLIGQGAVQMGMGDGTSVIPAVSQSIPVRYAATVYARFPNVVFAKTSSGIKTPADLKGKRIGIPGKYGSSWIMLLAMLASAGLTASDIDLRLYPDFGQGVAVAQDQVDAATGFANNEPVQLKLNGIDVTVLTIDAITPLPGPGLVVGTSTLTARRDALKAFVSVTLRAMRDLITDPQKGLDAAMASVPDLAADPTTQRAILDATIAMWSSPYTDAHGLGAIDRDGWQKSVDFMRSMPDSPVAQPVTLDQLVTTELLP